MIFNLKFVCIYSVECVKIDVLKLIVKYSLDWIIILFYLMFVFLIMWVFRYFFGEWVFNFVCCFIDVVLYWWSFIERIDYWNIK